MASNEIILNTCGICEKIIEDSLIPTHECFEGYKELIIDNNNIYPVSDTAGIIRRAMEHDVEDIVYDEPSSHPNTDNYVALEESFIRPLSEMNENILLNNSSDSMELEELLIEKSEKREVLCNYGLLAQSNSAITAKPWDAILESLQDIKNMTLEDP